MAYFYRLIFAFVLSLLAGSAFAIPLVPFYEYEARQGTVDVTGHDPADVCSRGVAATGTTVYKYSGIRPTVDGHYSCWVTWTVNGGGEGEWGVARYRSQQCPANSTLSGSSCVCSSGFLEQGDQCVPRKSEVCGPLQGMGVGISSMESDFGTQSAAWAGSMIGKSANSCMSGCQVSGSVTSCVVGTGGASSTVCYLSSPSFTGAACDGSTSGGSDGDGDSGDKPNDCPVGYEPSAYVPGLCIPKPNDCPSGSSPSKYAEGICIPDEKGDDGSCEDPKDPTKRAECEGTKNKCPSGQVQSTTQVGTCVPGTDRTGKDKDGNNVDCKGDKCTVTKPDGTTEDKDKGAVCEENPALPACKEGEGNFSGSCAAGFSCEGDAILCSLSKEVHMRNCQVDALKESDFFKAWQLDGNKEGNVTANLPGNKRFDISVTDRDEFLSGGSCPPDRTIELGSFGSLTLPFSELCPWLQMLGYVNIVFASVAGGLIIVRRQS